MEKFEVTLDPVLLGTLEHIPARESKIIRVFVSSTFTDMGVERNILMKETFPKLQDYFRRKGFEFQVVDMRWGVREESVLDHMATKLCTEEIRNSQKISRGVSFLALLGDKYGSCPLPAEIPTKDYKIFQSKLSGAKVSTQVLDEWYKLDENAVPPQYVLLPLTEKFPYFNSSDPDHVEKRIKERAQWNDDQAIIRNLLQQAANLAHKARDITEEHKHKYFLAVTEKEITSGILDDPESRKRTLCFIRHFDHLRASDSVAVRYADVLNGRYNQNSRLLLQQLKEDRIPAKVDSKNLFRYKIGWTSEGVNPADNQEHQEYLNQLNKDVFNSIIRLSEDRIQETTPTGMVFQKEWYYDIVHHLDFCSNKIRMYEMRRKLEVHCQRTLRLNKFQMKRPKFFKATKTKDILEEGDIQGKDSAAAEEQGYKSHPRNDVLCNGIHESAGHKQNKSHSKSDQETDQAQVTCHKPVIVSGPSGYGKTSLMAKIFEKFCSKDQKAQNCYDWLFSDVRVKIVRFLGTSPLSCSIREVLRSVIRQLWSSTGSTPQDSEEILEGNFASITEYFHELLWELEAFPGKILICLDSVDQLSPEDGAFYMNWLPLNFPENVTLFVSTLPDAHDILLNIHRLLHDNQCFIEIGDLSMSTAENILSIYGNIYGRTLTSHQRNIILKAFQNCSQPMFLKLAFEIAKEWRSFTEPKALVIGKSCKDLINQLFSRLQLQHGRSVVWALQYITSSREGLTDSEIEDLLSLDDHVLQDVYIYHLPPEPSVIRRIRQQLKEYLVEKESDGTTVVNWYHRQFWEAAKIHFSNTPKIHHHMATYFSGIWHGKPKPLTLYKGKKAEYPKSYRNVPAMPNTFGEGLPNLRKLSELPYHLSKSYIIDSAADILCNFKFLLCKLRYSGFKNVLSDFRVYFDTFAPNREKFADLVFVKMAHDAGKTLDELGVGDLTEQTLEVKIVYDLLVMSGDILKKDWTEFSANLAGRLSAYWKSYSRIHRLVADSKAWMYESKVPLLVPQYPCLQPPGGLLRTSINHSIHIPGRPRDYSDILYMSNKGLLYVREQQWDQKDIVRVYDTTNNGEMVQTIRLGYFIETMQFLRDEKFLLMKVLKRRSDTKNMSNVLLDFELKQKVAFPNVEAQLMVVSPLEDTLVVTHNNTQFSWYSCMEGKAWTLADTQTLDTESKIFRTTIGPDSDHVVLATTDGLLHCYSIAKKTMNKYAGYAVEADDEPGDLSSFKMMITTDNRLICRGIRADIASKLFVYDLATGDVITICEGNDYPVDILLMHKSEEWAAGATTYMVDNIAGGVAAKLNRPLYIWDIRTGKTYFRIKGNKGPYSAVTFLGQNHQFVAFSRKFDPGVIIVHIGTPNQRSFTAAELLKLGGHSKAVCCMLKDPSETMLITASPDNTIKIWDLSTTVALNEMAVDNKDMQKPIDRRKKEDQKKLCERYAVSGCMFGRVLFFDLSTGEFIVVQAHALHVKRVHTVLFTTDGEYVITAATEGRILMWDFKTGALAWCFKFGSPCHSICMGQNMLYVAHHHEEDLDSTNPRSFCSIWDTEDYEKRNKEMTTFTLSNCFWATACTNDGSIGFTWNGFIMVMFIPESDTVIDLKPPEKEEEAEGEAESDRAGTILVNADDKFAIATVFRTLFITDIGERKCSCALQFPSRLKTATFSTKDTNLILIGRYRIVDFVDVASGSILSSVGKHEEFIEALQLTCSDTCLVTVSQDKTAKLFFWERDNEVGKHELKELTRLTFHCPIRIVCAAQNLGFILIGPESAAPIAILTLNEALRKAAFSHTSIVPFVPDWLDETLLSETESNDNSSHTDSQKEDGSEIAEKSESCSGPEVSWDASESDVNLYISGHLSLSVSIQGAASCRDIASALSLNESSTNSDVASSLSSSNIGFENEQQSNLVCNIL